MKTKTNTRSQNILTFYVLFASIHSFIIATQINGVADYAMFYKLDIVDSFITPLIFPQMYLYCKSLNHNEPFSWKDYIWFTPAIVIGGGTFLLYQVMGEVNAARYIQSFLANRSLTADFETPLYEWHFLISVQLYYVTVILGVIGVSIYAVISLICYHHRLRDLNDESVRVNNAVLGCFILSLLLAFVLVILERQFLEQYPGIAMAFFLGWAIVCFGLCYHSSQMKCSIANLVPDLQQDDISDIEDAVIELGFAAVDTEIITVHAGRYDKLLNSLNKLIEEDKIFLKSNLRADEVARLMITNRAYVSRVIKENYQCSFSDFINLKRIEYAQALMLANPDMKQEEIASKSGFANASSLSRIFKQIAGIPPKEWLRKNFHA